MDAHEFINLVRKKYPNGFVIDTEKRYKNNLRYISSSHIHLGLSEKLHHKIELWSNSNQSKWFVRTKLKLIDDKEYSSEYDDFKNALKAFQTIVGNEVYFYEITKINASDILSFMQ